MPLKKCNHILTRHFAFQGLTIFLFVFLFFSLCITAQTKDKKPLIVFVTGDHEYSSESTMPILAAALEKDYGFRTIVLKSSPDQNAEENIPGLEALKDADLAVFFLRWRRLPAEQIKYIDDYLKSGKPMIGFRTTTHAFNYPKGHPLEKWNAFGERAFGAPPGWGGVAKHTHYGHTSSTDVLGIPASSIHPILKGVRPDFHVRSWLYRVLPDYPTKGSEWLLMGRAVKPESQPAIENPVAWTYKNSEGAKVFFTTLGHPEDFEQESLQRMVINAVFWTLDTKVPDTWKGKIIFNVPYRGM